MMNLDGQSPVAAVPRIPRRRLNMAPSTLGKNDPLCCALHTGVTFRERRGRLTQEPTPTNTSLSEPSFVGDDEQALEPARNPRPALRGRTARDGAERYPPLASGACSEHRRPRRLP